VTSTTLIATRDHAALPSLGSSPRIVCNRSAYPPAGTGGPEAIVGAGSGAGVGVGTTTASGVGVGVGIPGGVVTAGGLSAGGAAVGD
jgi:hypothetical protein